MADPRTTSRPAPTQASAPAPAGLLARGLAALLLVGLLAPVVGAAWRPPEPLPVPQRWQLDVKPSDLRMAMEDVQGERRAFLYITYQVTNNSGQDVLFAPLFELSTDQGHLLRSGRDVPASVTEEIIRRQRNEFLEDQIAITDQILQGEENARDGIAIWPVPSFEVDELTVYGAGFSGETAVEELPDGTEVLLRKTMRLRYALPGSLEGYSSRPLPRSARQDWVMR